MLVEQCFAAASANGLETFLTTAITPIRAPSPIAGQILPGFGEAVLGETLADVVNLRNWTEIRGMTRGWRRDGA